MNTHKQQRVSAYALGGTCVYVRAGSLEVVNATPYNDERIARAQRAAIERFGADSHTIFVQNAPEKISAQALALLGLATQILSTCTDSAVVVDGGKLEVVA